MRARTFVRFGLAAALASLAACALRSRPPPVQDSETEQELRAPMTESVESTTRSDAPRPSGPSVTISSSPQGQPAAKPEEKPAANGRYSKKTPIDFADETIDGDLTKPDGEYVEARKKTKQNNLLPNEPFANKRKPADEPDKAAAAKEFAQQRVVKPQAADPEAAQQMVFRHFGVNPTVETERERTSTFSVDVDTASYTVARAYLTRGQLPPPEAVRVEEFVNAQPYGYEPPRSGPFAVEVEAFPSPARRGYHVLHVGLKGREVTAATRKSATLIFTIDVSGSMNGEGRLGMVKRALELLVSQLSERDRVGIVVYGTTARAVLEPTPASEKRTLLAAINGLGSEGATNVQAGLTLAYQMAGRHFREDGVTRIILCSDGVANNGVTDADGIFESVKRYAVQGVALTTVGFGMGSYNDVLMERLAQVGEGQYAYVDRLDEARKLFVDQLGGTLEVIAKDVKIQLEFNPLKVARYRLVGFENRMLQNRDFADDRVDAGEIGAGHTVTAIYEVKLRDAAPAEALGTLRLRYKAPEGGASKLLELPLPQRAVRETYAQCTPRTQLSMIAAGFGEKLRGSYWARTLSYAELLALWERLPSQQRERKEVQELAELIRRASLLDQRGDPFEREAPLAQMDFDHLPVIR